MKLVVFEKCRLFLVYVFYFFLLKFDCSTNGTQFPECDVSVDSAICINKGQKILLPQSKPYGIVAHINFDSVIPVDVTGNRNHAVGKIFASTGFGGFGNSALFRKNYIYIPHNEEYFKTADFSYSFYIYLLEDEISKKNSAEEKYCPVIHKGIIKDDIKESSPAILINTKNGKIKIVLSTSSSIHSAGEEFLSNFRLRRHQWYHITVVRHVNAVRLFVDGILDSVNLTEGVTKTNDFPVYVGGTPYSEALCDFPVLLDELKIYNVSVGVDQIQSEASAALSGIEPSFLYFGCFNCDINSAILSCPNNYHLCNKIEMYIGVYNIMRKFSLETNNVILPLSPENQKGIGVCCIDI